MTTVRHDQIPEYKYYLTTWGGYYNHPLTVLAGHTPGVYTFDTREERCLYKDTLNKGPTTTLRPRYHEADGYIPPENCKLHRVCLYQGVKTYCTYKIPLDTTYEEAVYHLTYKWYPGFNHYPYEDHFDSVNYDEVEILSEWVSGEFLVKDGD